MRRSTLILALSVLASALPLAASAQEAKPTAPACLPAVTLDQLPKALDDAISGPGDKDRACLRQLMSADLRLVLVTGEAYRLLTLDDWIDAMRKRGGTIMIERQIKVRTETYGRIAHLWNTYEIRSTPDGQPTSRGINSIQAVFDGQHWQVVEVLWQAESSTDPIPNKYLQ
jgi:hypothetical protein